MAQSDDYANLDSFLIALNIYTKYDHCKLINIITNEIFSTGTYYL